jgi:hypothetical protein
MNYKGNSRFGALPRRTMIANQPHMLAYINPQEEMLLRQLGGTGQPGPMGVPAYPPGDGGFGFGGSGGYGGGGGFGGFGGSEAPGGGYGGPSQEEINNAFAIAEAAVANASVDADSGMGAAIGSTGGASDIGSGVGFLGVSDGGSGYVDSGTDVSAGVTGTDFDFGMGSDDGVSDVGTGDIGSGGVDFDSGGDFLGEFGGSGVDIGGGISAGVTGTDFDFGAGSIDGVGSSAGEGDVGITIDPYDNPYAIDITDTNIYTENPDGTYTVEDGEPDPIEIVGDEEGEPPANGGDTTNPIEIIGDGEGEPPAEYFNLFRSTAPSSWLRNSIWSAAGTGPDFDVDVYQEADGALRFRDTGDLVPEEYLKYIPYAKRTKMKAPGEEDNTVDDTVDDTVVDTDGIDDTGTTNEGYNFGNGFMSPDEIGTPGDFGQDGVQSINTVVDTDGIDDADDALNNIFVPASSTTITNQASDGSDFTDMTTIVDEPTDYSIDPAIAEATASTLSDRAQGFYDLVSSGEKGLYELNQLTLANNPMVRQAAQDAVNEYLYSNLTPDELRAWLDGQFNPITDPTSSVYNPQGIPEGLL